MVKRLYCAIFALLLLALSLEGFGATTCISPKLLDDLEKEIGITVSLFSDTRYLERVKIDGRQVLSLKSLDPGVPPKYYVNSDYKNVLEILDGGGSNLDLMKNGYAPIGPDGKQIELHHMFGEEPGPIAELEKTFHQQNTKALHSMINESFRNDKAKRDSWGNFKKAYWKERAKDFLN